MRAAVHPDRTAHRTRDSSQKLKSTPPLFGSSAKESRDRDSGPRPNAARLGFGDRQIQFSSSDDHSAKSIIVS